MKKSSYQHMSYGYQATSIFQWRLIGFSYGRDGTVIDEKPLTF